MFLAVSIKLVAISSFVVGLGNAVAYVIFRLTLPEPSVPAYAKLTYGILLTQLLLCAVGAGLYRMARGAWVAFWPAGLLALLLGAEQARRHFAETHELSTIPAAVALVLMMWFLTCAICLLLPSSRQYYFDEPDPIWMHKKALRAGRSRSGSISGRPRKPAGVSLLAWLAIGVAVFLFARAMMHFAEPDSIYEEAARTDVAAWVDVLGAAAIAVSAMGLFRTRPWGWVGMMLCAVGSVLVSGYRAFLQDGNGEAPSAGELSWFLLTLVWCGAAIICLLLPKVRRPFFSRHHSADRP